MIDRRQVTANVIERLALAFHRYVAASDPVAMCASEEAAHEHFRGLARTALSELIAMTEDGTMGTP